MSIFTSIDRSVSRTVDTVASVAFEVHPGQASPNGRYGPDPHREIWDGRGIFDEVSKDVPVEIGKRDRVGNDLRAAANGYHFELSVDRTRYPQARAARQGDRLVLDDMRKFEILSTQPDGLSRVMFQLAELRATPP